MRFELTQPNGHYPLKVACLPIPPPGQVFPYLLEPHRNEPLRGAKNGTRTRDPDLGKVVLYQLSYFRISRNFRFLAFPTEIRISLFSLSEKRDSNPRPRPWQGRALPTELFSHIYFATFKSIILPFCVAKLLPFFHLCKLFI